MNEWQNIILKPWATIREAIQTIDKYALKISLIIDGNQRLLGTVTDGDIRRALLKGMSLEEKVEKIMNCNPTVAFEQDSREKILAIMKSKVIHQIPIIDKNGRVVNVEFLDGLISNVKDNWVVLMAGGLGRRLSPLTDNCPKPLLKVGSKPILETIIENFIEYGFRKFYLAINYKAEMVQEYFGDGSQWGIEIHYIRENKQMGTAGALSLLNKKPEKPILVMNGDLLTKVNFQQLFDFHKEQKASATICVREYEYQIPYGVVNVEKHNFIGIDEKPIYRFFVNAGIYVLEPKVLDLIPKNMFYDMPSLFSKLLELKMQTVVFPVREYWLDIGRLDDFEKANGEYYVYFNNEAAVTSENNS